MKIGLIWSWYEMLPLMQILNQHDFDYHLYLDRSHRPWGDKSLTLQEERLEQALEYLDDKVDVLIVPPWVEHRTKSWEKGAKILPLFEAYIHEYALKHSLVGKLGVLVESEEQRVQSEDVIKNIVSEYTMSDSQKNTKKFDTKFPLWTKSVRMWNYFLSTYGRREPMLRKTLKHDLRYFSDAGIDTLIPMSWWFLFYQKIISQRVNWKKIRFHGLEAMQTIFDSRAKNGERWVKPSSYSITLHYTDRPTTLLNEKKWMSVLSRGGEIEVKKIEV